MQDPREARPSRFIKTLQRRADYLQELAQQGEVNSYDRAERRALLWAIETLKPLVSEQKENNG